MNALERLYPGDEAILLALNAALQIAGVVLACWCVDWMARRHAALRHSLWRAALLCVLLSPLTAWAAGRAGIGWWTPLRPTGEPPIASASGRVLLDGAIEPTTPPTDRPADPTTVTGAPVAGNPLPPTARGAAISKEPEPRDSPAAIKLTGPATLHVDLPIPTPPPLATSAGATKGAAASGENPAGIETGADGHTPAPRPYTEVLRFIAALAAVLWAVVTALLLARLGWGLWAVARFRRSASRPVVVDASTAAQVCRRLTLNALPPVLESAGVHGPITVGVFRQLILVPPGLFETLDSQARRDVLLHECTHVRHRDYVVGLLQQIAAAVFWPHPLIHLLNARLGRSREEVCDNAVLSDRQPAAYARTLLALAEWMRADEAATPIRISPLVGMLDKHWRLEDRVAGILQPGRAVMVRTRTRTSMVVALGVAGLGIGFGTVLSSRAADEAKRPAEQAEASIRSDVPMTRPAIPSSATPAVTPPAAPATSQPDTWTTNRDRSLGPQHLRWAELQVEEAEAELEQAQVQSRRAYELYADLAEQGKRNAELDAVDAAVRLKEVQLRKAQVEAAAIADAQRSSPQPGAPSIVAGVAAGQPANLSARAKLEWASKELVLIKKVAEAEATLAQSKEEHESVKRGIKAGTHQASEAMLRLNQVQISQAEIELQMARLALEEFRAAPVQGDSGSPRKMKADGQPDFVPASRPAVVLRSPEEDAAASKKQELARAVRRAELDVREAEVKLASGRGRLELAKGSENRGEALAAESAIKLDEINLERAKLALVEAEESAAERGAVCFSKYDLSKERAVTFQRFSVREGQLTLRSLLEQVAGDELKSDQWVIHWQHQSPGGSPARQSMKPSELLASPAEKFMISPGDFVSLRRDVVRVLVTSTRIVQNRPLETVQEVAWEGPVGTGKSLDELLKLAGVSVSEDDHRRVMLQGLSYSASRPDFPAGIGREIVFGSSIAMVATGEHKRVVLAGEEVLIDSGAGRNH